MAGGGVREAVVGALTRIAEGKEVEQAEAAADEAWGRALSTKLEAVEARLIAAAVSADLLPPDAVNANLPGVLEGLLMACVEAARRIAEPWDPEVEAPPALLERLTAFAWAADQVIEVRDLIASPDRKATAVAYACIGLGRAELALSFMEGGFWTELVRLGGLKVGRPQGGVAAWKLKYRERIQQEIDAGNTNREQLAETVAGWLAEDADQKIPTIDAGSVQSGIRDMAKRQMIAFPAGRKGKQT